MNKLLTFSVAVLLAAGAFAQDRVIDATASIVPESPTAGENRLEVVLTESGKPVAGLKLSSSVGMSNMDLGTAHPSVVEASAGHYVVHPMLLMPGPWRVTLSSADPKFTVSFDMTAGSKAPWRSAKQTITVKGPSSTEPPKYEPPSSVPKKLATPKQGPVTSPPDSHGMMSHSVASLPQLKEESSYTWSEAMDADTRTGFGKLAPMVRMMILMMVGGSGMEGMQMAPMEMKFDSSNFVENGAEPSESNAGAFKVDASAPKPSVGHNVITLTITTPDGKPVDKVKVTASVGMTNMDMGTTHLAVASRGKGRYSVNAVFSMAGPWRLTVTVSASGRAPSTYHFDFQAGSDALVDRP